MPGMSTETILENVDVTAQIEDGRVSMSAQLSGGVYVKTPEQRPLSAREPHATLRVADDDVGVTIDLNADAVLELVDALERSQGGGE